MNIPRRLLASCFALAALCGGQSMASAQSVSPVPAPTIITSAPYTITQSGYYQLGANINYNGTGAANEAIITIDANNVTLDFAGHYIAGPTTNAATSLYGIYAEERANLLILNGTISYCYFGVQLVGNGTASTNARNPRLLNMTLTKCYNVGANIFAAILPEVTGCRVSSIGASSTNLGSAYGINFSNCTGAKATGNSVANVATINNNNGTGVAGAAYAIDNQVTNCQFGLYNCVKYRDTLTTGCQTKFTGGTSIGAND